MKTSILIIPLLLSSALAAAAEPRFVDAETYFSDTKPGRALLPSGFVAARERLDEQFAAVCRDSFCEGTVANWAPLALSCSVDQVDHDVGECHWSFAGSVEGVDPSTGRVTVSHENRTCDLGLAGSAEDLAWFLADAGEAYGHAYGLITSRIPGRADGATLFDVLSDCL